VALLLHEAAESGVLTGSADEPWSRAQSHLG
jgi:hypothetical protein